MGFLQRINFSNFYVNFEVNFTPSGCSPKLNFCVLIGCWRNSFRRWQIILAFWRHWGSYCLLLYLFCKYIPSSSYAKLHESSFTIISPMLHLHEGLFVHLLYISWVVISKVLFLFMSVCIYTHMSYYKWIICPHYF